MRLRGAATRTAAARSYSARMNVSHRVGVVCQWCERVIQGGGEALTLVTCLRCAQAFGTAARKASHPFERAQERDPRNLVAAN